MTALAGRHVVNTCCLPTWRNHEPHRGAKARRCDTGLINVPWLRFVWRVKNGPDPQQSLQGMIDASAIGRAPSKRLQLVAG